MVQGLPRFAIRVAASMSAFESQDEVFLALTRQGAYMSVKRLPVHWVAPSTPPPCLPLSHSRVLANFREVLRMPFHFLPNHCLEPDFDGRAPPPMVLRQYQAVLDRSGGAELGIRGPVFRLQTPGVQGGHLHAPAKTLRINLNNMSFLPQHLPGWS